MSNQPASVRRMSARSVPARPYLEVKSTLRVRFNEVDTLQIVWHGHYVNYFEEGRRAFGRRYGVDYTTFLEHQIAIPIIHLDLEYLAPARLQDSLEVTTRLLKSESARLDFEYRIHRQSDQLLLAVGNTSQVFTSPSGELLLCWPEFMIERLNEWESLWINHE